MSIEEFAYLWDGTEKGWKLQHIQDTRVRASVLFSSENPTIRELSQARQLLDEFRETPITEIRDRLLGRSSYTLPHLLSNLEFRRFAEKAARLNLQATASPIDRSGYLPVDADGSMLIIEDNEVAAIVVQRMLDAGVDVEMIEVD